MGENMKIVCAQCRNEIPEGSVAIEYSDKVFDSYQCLIAFNGDKVSSEGSISSAIRKSTLKTILSYEQSVIPLNAD
jgi:hypothetical protein